MEQRVKKLLDKSSFWNSLNSKGTYLEAFEKSLSYRLLNWILNVFPGKLNRIYVSFENHFAESRFIQYLKFAADRFEVIAALLLVFIMLVPHNYWNNMYNTAIVLALLLLFIFKTIINSQEKFNLKAMDYTLIIFMFTIILAEVTSLFPKESMKFFIFYMTCFLMVLIIVSGIRNGRSLERFLVILMLGVSLTGLYAIYQRIKGIPMDPSLTDVVLNEGMSGRAYSTMGNPNNYAELLILILPFFIAMTLNAKSLYRKVFYFVLSIPPLIALFLTGARSSWIALILAVLVFVLLKDWKLIPFVAVLGILGFLFLPYVSPSVYKRVLTIFTGTDTSINYRQAIYQTVTPMFKDFWFTGLGLGSGVEQAPFMKILQRYSLYYLQKTSSVGYATTPPHTHNLFLQIWIEAGLIGIATFLWFTARTVKRAIVNIFKGTDQSMKHISMAGISAFSGIFIMGMAEYVWFYPRVMLFFWVIAGVLLSSLNSSDQGDLLES